MEKERKASKENRGILALVSIILVILLITGAGGYTYARYMAQEKGTGKAEIASWSFKIDKEGKETKTINLVNTANKQTLVNGKIAPGTSGEFSIILDARGSDVGVDYIVRFMNEKNKPTNIFFTYNEQKYKSLEKLGDITGSIMATGEKVKVIKVQWEWPYQTGLTNQDKQLNDGIDTKEAVSATDYTFELLAIGTQSN